MAADFEYSFTGKFSDDCRSLIIDFGDKLARIFYPLKERQLEISIKPFYKQRTSAQNRWIHGPCVTTIQAWLKETTGVLHSHDAVYTFLRTRVIGDEPVIEEIDGIEVITLKGKRFSQCSTVEFAERVDKIVEYYRERGLEIPLPQPGTNNLLSDYVII
jgi:hypothetical protein